MVEMVEDTRDLGNAIALNSSMVNVARLIGPSLAGVVIAAVGEGWCFLIDGISYIAVIASLLVMRLRPLQCRSAQRHPACSSSARAGSMSAASLPIRTSAAALCAGQPDGHALHGADAGLRRRRCCTAARIRSAS